MVAINHALTGAVIGFSVVNPIAAIILAILSHFVLDTIPHFSSSTADKKWFKTKTFIAMLVIDACLCFLLVLELALKQPLHWQLAAICAFAAAAPDFLHFNGFYKLLKHKAWKPSAFTRFTGWIQWFQRPIGAVVEVAWFVGIVTLLRVFV